ncbi:unnamed protein product [Parnassius mnemosyne]|uniref:Endonuclease/exonuclease/phosphatase domain-containing protein n=1 Tax=Parnassius mnemosyne TaxID=213953 RepID=A0AAV1KWE9_9NEOP
MPQRSTEESLYDMMQLIRTKLTDKKLILLISLDIEGAFDNAWWPAIKCRLAETACPVNLRRLIDIYLKDRMCNIDRSKNSLHELFVSFMAGSHDIVLLSEPYVGPGLELKAIHGVQIIQFPSSVARVKACILVRPGCGSIIGLTQYSTPSLCIARLSAGNRVIYIASVYIEPDRDESATLDKLDVFLKATGDSPKIIGGDFNGWHPIWGSPVAFTGMVTWST